MNGFHLDKRVGLILEIVFSAIATLEQCSMTAHVLVIKVVID